MKYSMILLYIALILSIIVMLICIKEIIIQHSKFPRAERPNFITQQFVTCPYCSSGWNGFDYSKIKDTEIYICFNCSKVFWVRARLILEERK